MNYYYYFRMKSDDWCVGVVLLGFYLFILLCIRLRVVVYCDIVALLFYYVIFSFSDDCFVVVVCCLCFFPSSFSKIYLYGRIYITNSQIPTKHAFSALY